MKSNHKHKQAMASELTFLASESRSINTKQLERAMKLCKQILKNQYSETGMNDLV